MLIRRSILTILLSGCGPKVEVLETSNEEPPVVPACHTVQLTGDGMGSQDVALDETDAYWASHQRIFRADIATGATTPLYQGDASIRGIAIDESHVYAVEEISHDEGRLLRVPKDGGAF